MLPDERTMEDNSTNTTTTILDLVFEDDSGNIRSPIEMNPFIVTSLLICLTVGCPANFYVAANVIVRDPQWTRKPRILILLAIIFSNLWSYALAAVELVHFYRPTDSTCKVYVAMFGLPYVAFLLCNLFSLMDNYMAVSDPLWHRSVPSRSIMFCIYVVIAALTVFVKWIYIVQWVPLGCDLRIFHLRQLAGTYLVLIASCISARIIVFVKTRRSISQSRIKADQGIVALKYPPDRERNDIQSVALQVDREDEQQVIDSNTAASPLTPDGGKSSTPPAGQLQKMQVHVSEKRLKQLQAIATETLILGLTSFFLMGIPMAVFVSIRIACISTYPLNECNSTMDIRMYITKLPMVHCTLFIIVYIVRMFRQS